MATRSGISAATCNEGKIFVVTLAKFNQSNGAHTK